MNLNLKKFGKLENPASKIFKIFIIKTQLKKKKFNLN